MDPQLIMNVVDAAVEEDHSTTKQEEELEAKTIEVELVDPEVWHEGICREWKNTWGFLQNVETNEQIFVHAANCRCSDRHTFLRKGMKLKYQEGKRTDSERRCAANVCALDGEPFSFFEAQGDTDTFSRKSLNPGVIYKGTVKNYFFRRKFGRIQPDEPAEDEPEHPPFLQNGIYVARQDIMTEEFPPGLRTGDKVEFQLYEDDRGIGACNVTGPDGSLIANSMTPRKDYNGVVFTGEVQKFQPHGYLFIKPDLTPEQDLKEYGVWGRSTNLYADAESINTEQRPALIREGQRVTFSLLKEKGYNFHAVNINDEFGNPIVVEDWEEDHVEDGERVPLSDEVFSGSVTKYSWGKGSGWVLPDALPAEIAEQVTHSEGLVYFIRKDLNSMDKVWGILQDTKVRFKLYKNDKGVGASEISDEHGNPLQNQQRPNDNNTLQTGQVSYYDRQKRVLHVRYKGKIHPIPKKHCIILREAEHYLRRGVQVEFLVERYRGRNFLKQVSFPGRRAKPRESDIPQYREHDNNFRRGGYNQSHQVQQLFNPYAHQGPYVNMNFFGDFLDQNQRRGFPQFPGSIQNPTFGSYR